MNDVQQRLATKLNESKAFTLMHDFQEEVAKYPAAHISCNNPKREAAVLKASEPLYKFHTVFSTPKNEYGNSVILVSNDMVIPYMAKEVAAFVYHLEVFYQEIKKANNVQELQQYYKQFTLKPKQLSDALVEDAKLYAERYGFELDIRSMMDTFKAHKELLASQEAIKLN